MRKEQAMRETGTGTSPAEAAGEAGEEILLDGFRVVRSGDPAQCSTRIESWLGTGLCREPAVMLVLCGCLGEALVWGRKCEWCLGHLEAGLHTCIMCPEPHPIRALRVVRDVTAEVTG